MKTHEKNFQVFDPGRISLSEQLFFFLIKKILMDTVHIETIVFPYLHRFLKAPAKLLGHLSQIHRLFTLASFYFY